MGDKRELSRPPGVEGASRTLEVLRVWRVDDHEEFVLRADAWADPAAWGLLLVDVARHAAKAYETQGRDPTEALARIREGFDAEWTSPTDEAAPTKMR